MKKLFTTIFISLIVIGAQTQTALTFSGTGDQYVAIDSISSIDFQFAEEFTVEAWTKQTTLGRWPTILSNYDGSVNVDASGYWFGVNSSGKVGFQVYDSTGIWNNLGGTTYILDGNWHHVAGVYRNDSMFVFVDGVFEGSAIGPVTAKYSGQPLWFGTDNVPDYLLGEIDNIRIWDVARTSNEIQMYKDSCLNGSENNLIGLWHFDEGGGSTVLDVTTNGHDGTLVNMDSISSWVTGTNICQVTGTIENSLSDKLVVFPNPNNGNFYLRLLSNDIQITEISLYDPSGRLVKNYQGGLLKNKEISINTNTISKGIYLLKIMTGEGLVTRKIMVR